jgi:hypothetical protein
MKIGMSFGMSDGGVMDDGWPDCFFKECSFFHAPLFSFCHAVAVQEEQKDVVVLRGRMSCSPSVSLLIWTCGKHSTAAFWTVLVIVFIVASCWRGIYITCTATRLEAGGHEGRLELGLPDLPKVELYLLTWHPIDASCLLESRPHALVSWILCWGVGI